MLTAPAAIKNTLRNERATFARLVYSAGLLAHTDHPSALTIGTITYSPTARVLDIGGVKRTRSIGASSLDIAMTNTDQAFWQTIQSGDIQGKVVSYSIAFLNGDTIIGGAALLLYSGTIDRWEMDESADEDSIVRLQLTSEWARYEGKNIRHASQGDQINIHAGDDFFKAAAVEQPEIKWGG